MFTRAKYFLVPFFWLLLAAGGVSANPLNGTWQLDAAAAETLEEAAAAMNAHLKEEYRRYKEQKFAKDEQVSTRGNRFLAQQRATAMMIRENDFDIDWGGPPEVRGMLSATTIKLYQDSKAVILYDGTRRRLLAINPAGRAYSVKGTELTKDDIGRSLTFVEDGALVVETDVYNGDKMIERFESSAGSDLLTLTIRLQEGRRSPWLEYERVFKRVE
ncbi:MAG: hypothetical protein WD928_18270 [Gammaproteobacteria bacterium]